MIADKYTVTSYITNGAVALFGALNFEFIMMFIGLILALVTCITNYYFRRRQDKRDVEEAARKEEYHELRMDIHNRDFNKEN
jgi:hypothetical protein